LAVMIAALWFNKISQARYRNGNGLQKLVGFRAARVEVTRPPNP
jgi:hypothetical protein